ncbi:MAG TPA: LytTR family DNA-binding domain-containing protein [Flavobacteriales bacterium]|nr:LytTR family DNA-binding domain-containing protein [Flavobacteriales bacterium]HNI04485.1 LytTR family DNA-binding domain-containing protein [Flavobacteriales bacterium]HNK41742.1 LytTR family DNA-binding domain-containing protein [Flavobacteriales bacterium]HNK69429.1 LytTR family DNA-binding domain-containing protein [Flavobacteriales bacterium]HNK83770.1 LytTR family DNA-binding domain-containing protein [Flavobacteriales bacterium]
MEPELTAVLVDDEEHCTDMLAWMLAEYCPQVHVAAIFNNPEKALHHLRTNRPDVLFLDIEMPGLNGFDLLTRLGHQPRALVFCTAYDQFAIKAIKHQALDYLLKPVDKDELRTAVSKAAVQNEDPDLLVKVGKLLNALKAPAPAQRIAIPTRDGLEMVDVERIIHAQADDNYTELHLDGGKRIVVSRTLKDIEADLPGDRFMRVHSGHLVALPFIVRYVRGNGGFVVLPDGVELPVSRAKKDELLARLGAL